MEWKGSEDCNKLTDSWSSFDDKSRSSRTGFGRSSQDILVNSHDSIRDVLLGRTNKESIAHIVSQRPPQSLAQSDGL